MLNQRAIERLHEREQSLNTLGYTGEIRAVAYSASSVTIYVRRRAAPGFVARLAVELENIFDDKYRVQVTPCNRRGEAVIWLRTGDDDVKS